MFTAFQIASRTCQSQSRFSGGTRRQVPRRVCPWREDSRWRSRTAPSRHRSHSGRLRFTPLCPYPALLPPRLEPLSPRAQSSLRRPPNQQRPSVLFRQPEKEAGLLKCAAGNTSLRFHCAFLLRSCTTMRSGICLPLRNEVAESALGGWPLNHVADPTQPPTMTSLARPR